MRRMVRTYDQGPSNPTHHSTIPLYSLWNLVTWASSGKVWLFVIVSYLFSRCVCQLLAARPADERAPIWRRKVLGERTEPSSPSSMSSQRERRTRRNEWRRLKGENWKRIPWMRYSTGMFNVLLCLTWRLLLGGHVWWCQVMYLCHVCVSAPQAHVQCF